MRVTLTRVKSIKVTVISEQKIGCQSFQEKINRDDTAELADGDD